MCILALCFSISYQVLAKIASTAKDATQNFGATLVHESNNIGTGAKVKYAYRVNSSSSGFTSDYRIYAGDNDYENTIICLRKDAYFPKQDSSGTGNYKSLGEATETTLRTAYSSIDTTEKANKILWLIENAVLPEDSEDLKNVKLSKLFKNFINSQSATVNAVTLTQIKNNLTEDDLVFAYQCAVWEIINNGSVIGRTWEGSTNGSNWNELNQTKKSYLTEMINFYIAQSSDLTPATDNSKVVPKITSSTGSTKQGDRIYVGPFKIEPSDSSKQTFDYAVDIKFKNTSGNYINVSNYYLTDNTFSNILKQTKESLENKQFYVAVPVSSLARSVEVRLPIDTIITSSIGTVWQAVTNASSMQPLLSVARTEEPKNTVPKAEVAFEIPNDRTYDVALRKYIRTIYKQNGQVIDVNRNLRVQSEVPEGFTGNYYLHAKDPISVDVGDRVVYGFKLINEGNSTINVEKINDYYPTYGLTAVKTGLKFSTAKTNFMTATSSDKVTLTLSPDVNTDYLATLGPKGSSTESSEIFIEFQVTENAKGKVVTNIAEILEAKDGNGNTIYYNNNKTSKDADSYYGDSNSWLPKTDDEWQNYKGNSENKDDITDSDYFYKGQQDDDDFEKIYVPDEKPDLALRKSAVSVKTADSGSANELNRQRRPDTTPLKEGTGTTSNFSDEKNPVSVKAGDIVTYTIRVFNEGSVDGYASKIDDIIPEGLGFIPNHVINNSNGWQLPSNASGAVKLNTIPNATTNLSSSDIYNGSSQADVNNADVYPGPITVSTRILDPENSTLTDNDKLLKAYDKTSDSLTIKEIQVVCVVLDGANEDTLRNIAAITEYKGKDKNIINYPDEIDSNYNNNLNNFNENNHEDDEDFEKLTLSSNPYDLALKKYVSSVKDATNYNKTIPDSQKRSLNVTNSDALVSRNNSTDKLDAVYSFGVDKAEQPVQVQKGDSVVYTIRLYNEGLTDAKVTELIDTVPEGLTLIDKNNSSINSKYGWEPITNTTGWTSGVKTDYLNGKVIPAFDKNKGNQDFDSSTEIGKQLGISYTEVKIEFKVTTSDNKLIKNIAEITNDDGDDNDSTPNNKDENEDDEDFDNIIPIQYDLALKKFVSELRDATNEKKSIPDEQEREALVTSVDDLDSGNSTDAEYKYGSRGINKEQVPVTVEQNDYVTYTIRVYNEGLIDGQATKIVDKYNKDEIEFIDNEFNRGYGWVDESENSSNSGKITTEYLKGKTIPKFNSEQSTSDSGLNKDENGLWYREVKVQFRVKTSEIKKLRNIAEIVADDGDDIDSKPDGRNDSNVEEDDEDFDVIIPKTIYDLALKKYVASLKDENDNSKDIADNQRRELKITDVSQLESSDTSDEHDATYEFGVDKFETPVRVQKGDYVVYTIRVYNEGRVPAKVEEVIESIPAGLTFDKNREINKKYGWEQFQNEDSDGWSAGLSSKYFKDTTIPGFNSDKNNKAYDENSRYGTDMGVSYIELQIEYKVDTSEIEEITNIAEIIDDDGDDQDSTPNNDDPDEDDYDFDIILPSKFDLSLRKFITQIENNNVNDRVPTVDTSALKDESSTTAKYTHTKEPKIVTKGQTVIYTIRVYNEGSINGYVAEIKDDIPQGLTYLPNHEINKEYGWKMYDSEGKETTDETKVKTIRTNYGAITTDPDRLLNRFDNSSDSEPSSIDIKVAFKVTQDSVTDGNTTIINTAEITKETDEEGNPIDDIDSNPDNDKDGEDDIDKEYLKLQYFDLSLLKYVSKVIVTEDGVTKETETKYDGSENPEPVVKVELNKKKLASTQVKYVYSIKVTNEGQIEGYAKEVTDRIPAGLAFYEEDNKEYNWKIGDKGIVTTDYLANKLLKPGESAIVQIVLRWENSGSNLGQKVNVAEITKDENPYGVPDIDSTPNNNKDGEDDQDLAIVVLSITTGSAPMYIALTTIIVAILGAGLYLIYKHVVKK